MGRLELTLLGPFQATLDGTSLRSLTSAMARALLAYLAVEAGSPHPREILAALLWPEQPNREALSRLRHTLSDLRRVLGDDEPGQPFLVASREAVRFNPAADCDLDVATFSQAISALPQPGLMSLDQETAGRLERAVALYRGGFLEGLAVSSARFEEWVLLKREQLHWQTMGALQLLAATCEARGEYARAQRYAQRQLELQPWQEEAHRQLMRALALGGQRSAALAQYQTCVQRLAAELGVAPADETVALYQTIRDGKLAGTQLQKPAVDAERIERAAGPATPAFLTTSHSHILTPAVFVSREAELAKLDGFLEMALAGRGRVAFVSGLAGSGKTALLAEFSRQEMARYPDLVTAGGNCNAHAGQGDPYLPFREIVQLLSGEIEAHRAGGSLSPEHARRLWALLPVTAQALAALGPDLVGTFVPGEPLLRRIQAFAPDGTARWQRLEALARRAAVGEATLASQADLFDQVTRVLQAVAAQHPLLLLLDDLQWADHGTLGLLFHLGRRLGTGRILIAGAYRPDTVAVGFPSRANPSHSKRSDWGRPHERHPLEPILNEFIRDWGDIQIDLDQADGRAFVEALLDAEPNRLGAAFRETLYHHTAGNPLFTIELLRGLQERDGLLRDEAGRWVEGTVLDSQRLPARVEAVIAERFGRLPAECQELLQVASVEGEEFTAEVLARVADLALPKVIRCLSETLGKQHRLVHAARLLHQEPGNRYLSCYRFAHILFQRYVYDQLDEVARTQLHRAVAEALEALRPEGEAKAETTVQDPTAPVRQARHWEVAGQFDKAATCLLHAGRRAAQLSAHEEAVHLFRQGLALLEHLREGPERAELEKQILMGLIRPLMPAQGWGSAERAELAQRALDLALQQPSNEIDLIGALYQRAETLGIQAKHAEGLDLIEVLLHLARRVENPAYVALGHFLRGQNRFFAGDMATSLSDFQQALALYDPDRHVCLLPLTGADLGVYCRAMLACTLSNMGYADQGKAYSQQALASAREMAHPLTQALALMFAGCVFHAFQREIQPTEEYACRLIALSEQKQLPAIRSFGLVFQGWAWALGGAGERAIAQMRDGLAEWQGMGHRSGTPFLILLLAQALQHGGAVGEALAMVEEGLALLAEISPLNRAEFYRLKGELLNDRDRSPAFARTDTWFRAAIAEGRRHGVKLRELRATVSLARLWAEQGRREEARQALAEIYSWFTEGSDTPDLQVAKALLDTLRDPIDRVEPR